MTDHNWKSLLSRPTRPAPTVLSVYLNVDQSRQANLNSGFQKKFKELMASFRNTIRSSVELESLRIAKHHLSDFLTAYAPKGRTLVMFFDTADNFFWHDELAIPVQDMARWDRDLLLKPLAAATDEFERYGVVLVDRANARLFTVSLGDIEEAARENFDPMKVRHIKTVGTDHWGSASQVQRKADEQIRSNLRQAADDLDSLVKSKRIDRVILAGTPEITAELRELLPKRLAVCVIGELKLDVDAPPKDVLEATLPLTEKYERGSETQLVTEVETAAAKATHAVIGLGHTLKKVNEARVWQLIYSENFHCSGFECPKCSALFSVETPACSYCGAALVRVADVVEKTVERALRKEAKIELVRGEAASSLDNAGGIAAFLKARTESFQM